VLVTTSNYFLALSMYSAQDFTVRGTLYATHRMHKPLTASLELLKKYRKWSGSARLPDRFTVLLESPTAFHRLNFDQNVLEVSELLKAVRDGINSLSDSVPDTPCQPARTSGDKHISYCESTYSAPQQTVEHSTESRLESDVAFGTSRITAGHGGRATFWVHHD
jgi:hypothetical protein